MLTVPLLAATVAPAHATGFLDTTVTVPQAVERSCSARELGSGAGFAHERASMPASGWVTARLSAEGGDWDLAVFEAGTGRRVAAASSFGASEVAQGIAADGARLVVQACRRSGDVRAARITLAARAVEADRAAQAQLVRVSVGNRARLRELQGLGLDLTEHGGRGFQEVVLYGARDARKLREHKFVYAVEVGDLIAQDRRFREADRAYAASVPRSGLPSGRTGYRHLADYSEEMKQLAADNPDLVRIFTLPHETWEGRPVEGIEIATNPDARDGRPVFLQMGLHHAREWPSGEHALEWAYELIAGYRSGDPRATALVEGTRTAVVPVVNPDGFETSREAGELLAGGEGRGGIEIANIVTHPYEYRRKNCRRFDQAESGECLQPSFGLAEPGVDPNRNYGGLWGGPGASTAFYAQDYRGPGPFSEAETRNVQDLVSKRQVTALITNHTYSNLVLRPPGIQAQGQTPDEPVYKALGDAMAGENGYASQFGYELYDTTGTTEDWSYWSTGGLGFTFEIGPRNFHPPFEGVVAEWEGTTQAAGEGGGNREAYYLAHEAAADPARHAVIRGTAPEGAVLRLQKTFETETFPQADGNPIRFQDHLETALEVPPSGSFEWHVNPSTRPIVARESGRPAVGEPSPPQAFSGAPSAAARPCPDYFDQEDPPDTCWNDHPFEVPAGDGIDNAKATIRVEWFTPATDWDMEIYRDSNGDGSSAGEGEPIGSSTRGTTDNEVTTLVEPVLEPGAKYVVRVINWAAVEPYQGTVAFAGPDPHVPAQTEAWLLTCETPDGAVHGTREVVVARGQQVDVTPDCGQPAAGARGARGKQGGRRPPDGPPGRASTRGS